MEPTWYIQDAQGRVEGPLSSGMLKARAQQKLITPSTVLKKGTDGKWTTAAHVKGLFPQSAEESQIAEWLATPKVEPPADAIPLPPPPPLQSNQQTASPVSEDSPPESDEWWIIEDDDLLASLRTDVAPPAKPIIQWYVTTDGVQKGPLTDAEIRRWVSQGQVQPDTFVRQGPDGEWNPASEFPALFNRIGGQEGIQKPAFPPARAPANGMVFCRNCGKEIPAVTAILLDGVCFACKPRSPAPAPQESLRRRSNVAKPFKNWPSMSEFLWRIFIALALLRFVASGGPAKVTNLVNSALSNHTVESK